MYKIVAAVNSMIEHSYLIERVFKGDYAYYFLYDKKFKWSIARTGHEEYYLAFYPGNQQLEDLPNEDQIDFKEYVVYSTKDIKAREALESFSELYQTVQNKLYGIDEVLDQIIKTAA